MSGTEDEQRLSATTPKEDAVVSPARAPSPVPEPIREYMLLCVLRTLSAGDKLAVDSSQGFELDRKTYGQGLWRALRRDNVQATVAALNALVVRLCGVVAQLTAAAGTAVAQASKASTWAATCSKAAQGLQILQRTYVLDGDADASAAIGFVAVAVEHIATLFASAAAAAPAPESEESDEPEPNHALLDFVCFGTAGTPPAALLQSPTPPQLLSSMRPEWTPSSCEDGAGTDTDTDNNTNEDSDEEEEEEEEEVEAMETAPPQLQRSAIRLPADSVWNRRPQPGYFPRVLHVPASQHLMS